MELANVSLGIWGAFLSFVLLMLALDLGVFHRKAHRIEMKEALMWSAVWVGLALVFNLGVYAFWDRIQPESGLSNQEAALAFLAGYLVEKALSVDNIFVFLLIFSYFSVPDRYQHRVLFWGIVGALVMRGVLIAAGAASLMLLQRRHHLPTLLLQSPHLRIAAVGREQLRVGAAFDDPALVHHQDLVGVHHGR